jgi:sugar phosphate isomerase/epimerase
MKNLLLRLIASLMTLAAPGCITAADTGPKLGLQTWTCRNMTFDQIVEFSVRHHLKYVQFTGTQLNPADPKEETLRKKAVLDQKGIVPYTMGVMGTSLDKEENRRLFELARLMGMKLIVVEPMEQSQWDDLEALVKEYDIRLAIHNHGTGTVYGDPATVKKVLARRDPRIGVCLDIGWVTAAGFDAAKVFKEYGAERVFDMHFKDKKIEAHGDEKVVIDTEPGRGDANYKDLFAAMKQTGWSGVMAIETDSKAFAEDPNPLVDASARFFAELSK